MKQKKVVFITGSGHSGSTLLGLILSSHSKVFGLGEMINVPRLLAEDHEHHTGICYICEGQCPFWNQQVPEHLLRQYFSEKTLLDKGKGLYHHYQKSIYEHLFDYVDEPILVDFSKPLKWIKHQLRPVSNWRNMTPMLLMVTRDGRAVTNSYLRKYPERGMTRVATFWRNSMYRSQKFFDSFPENRRYMVAYEQLALNPQATAAGLCEFLGMAYEEDMLKYWMHDHHTVSGNVGTRSLIYKYRDQEVVYSQDNHGDKGVEEVLKERHGDYYEKHELKIKLDLRWKDELSQEQLDIFDAIAGTMNQKYAFEK